MAMTQQSVVIGIFNERAQAERAVDELQQAGFSNDQIRLSQRGASGGFLEGIKSLFTGQDTTTGGNVVDDLAGMGVPQQDASYYQQEYEAGRTIVSVTGASQQQQQDALTILSKNGAYNASNRSNQMAGYASSTGMSTQAVDTGTTYDNSNTYAQTSTSATDYTSGSQTGTASTDYASDANTGVQPGVTNTGDAQRLQLREEQLTAQKQPVQTGEARLRKEVLSEQQTLDVPVTHEEVYVERRPASGEVSDAPIGEGETIRVPVSHEEVNVSKQTVDTGEVAIGKRQFQENQQVSDTVRREEARLEREGDVNVQGQNLNDSSEQNY